MHLSSACALCAVELHRLFAQLYTVLWVIQGAVARCRFTIKAAQALAIQPPSFIPCRAQ